MRRIMIVAGEPSGDAHAADMVRQALELEPDLKFVGLGGPRMAEAGVEIIFDPIGHSSTGVTEIISSIPRLLPYMARLEELARSERPAAAILVDYPEFNLRLAKRLKGAGTKVVYYISPQLWAWREWRVRSVRKYVDEMIVLFHFEEEFYRRHGVAARFVGHPLVDQLAAVRKDPVFRTELGIPKGDRLVGLLPGSRTREVRYLYPPMVGAAQIMHRSDPAFSFVTAKAPSVGAELFEGIKSEVPIRLVEGRAHEVMANCDFLMVASGTATLEAALIGTPMIVVYKASPITYHLCKPLKKTKYMALVNILAGRQIVPELLQYQVTPRVMARMAIDLISGGRLVDISEQLHQACRLLGPPGASRRAAQELLKIIEPPSDNEP